MAEQADEGLKCLAEAANIVEATQERWAEAEMHRLRGTLLLSMHERAAAEDSFRLALTVAQQQSAKFWELRAATNLASLWRDQGKRTEARDLLRRSTDGSPKAWTRRCCRTPRHCSTSWRDPGTKIAA